jgi:hypothetical protein
LSRVEGLCDSDEAEDGRDFHGRAFGGVEYCTAIKIAIDQKKLWPEVSKVRK